MDIANRVEDLDGRTILVMHTDKHMYMLRSIHPTGSLIYSCIMCGKNARSTQDAAVDIATLKEQLVER